MLLMMLSLPLIALVFIFYFAVSKRSSPMVKRLAVIALILAAITLVVSVVLIVTAPPQEVEAGPAALPFPVKPVAPVQKVNWQELMVFALLFILVLVFLFAFSRRNVPAKNEREDDSYPDAPYSDDIPPGRGKRRP
jgi:formate hydrogenlyase subunit 3/multisubunit Na+/H+ antiporter MnhD subunit